MDLKNGYKVIYEKTADGKRTFYASKTGLVADGEKITEATIGEYKLIYEKDGDIYGSTENIPTKDDHCFEDLRAVFVEASAVPTNTIVEPDAPVVEPKKEPEVNADAPSGEKDDDKTETE